MQKVVIDIVNEPVLEEIICTGLRRFDSKTFVKAEIKTLYINQDPELPNDESSSDSDVSIELLQSFGHTFNSFSKPPVENSIPNVFQTPDFVKTNQLEPKCNEKDLQRNQRKFSFMNPVNSFPKIILNEFQLQLRDLNENTELNHAFEPNQFLSENYCVQSDKPDQSLSVESDQEDKNSYFFGEPSWLKHKTQSHQQCEFSKVYEELSTLNFVQSVEVELKSTELLPPEDEYYNQFQKEMQQLMQSNCQIQKVPKARASQKKILLQKEKQRLAFKNFAKKTSAEMNPNRMLEDVPEEDSNYRSRISKSNPSLNLSFVSRFSKRTKLRKLKPIRSMETDLQTLKSYDRSEFEKELCMDQFIIPVRYSAEGIQTYNKLQKQIVNLCIKVGVDPNLYSTMFVDESIDFIRKRNQIIIPKRLCSEKKCVAKLHEIMHQDSMKSMITQQLQEVQVVDTQKELQWIKILTNILTKRIISFHEEETNRVRQMNKLLAINMKQNQYIQSLLRKHKAEKKELHFAFMFACPLVLSFAAHNQTKLQMVPQLNYRKEFQIIKQKLAECKAKVTITSQQCTIESLQEVLRQKPLGIHFSGHGIKNTFDNVGEFHYQQQHEGDFLLLETLEGDSKLVSRQKLQNLISTAQCKLDFVVVATCHSEFVGRIFLEAGAEHVICIRNSDEVADEVVLHFTSTFYSAVFSQKESICKAFEYAQLSVKINHNAQQAGVFKLLLRSKLPQNKTVKDCHKCFVFGPFSNGNYTVREPYDVTFKMPSNRQIEVVGRQKDMYILISKITSANNHLITLMGLPGVGKSSLIKATLQYIQDRSLFRGGLVITDARTINNCEQFVRNLNNQLISEHQFMFGSAKECNQNQKLDCLSTFILIIKKMSYIKEDILLVIDNCSDLITQDKQNFKVLISTILATISSIKILLTTRIRLGSSVNEANEEIVVLSGLTTSQT